jgi:hypothetical protein
MVEQLTSKQRSLSSNSSMAKEREKERGSGGERRKGERWGE